jgi:hypothetical protein
MRQRREWLEPELSIGAESSQIMDESWLNSPLDHLNTTKTVPYLQAHLPDLKVLSQA